MSIQSIASRPVAPKFEPVNKIQNNLPYFGGKLQRELLPDGVTETFEDVVILGGARTPFGKMGGELKDVSASDLLSIAMNATVKKTGVTPDDIRQVLVGNIIANDPQQPFLSRAMSVQMGVPHGKSVTMEVNRLCGTGFELVRQAAEQLSNGGENAIIMTGGVENMTRTPMMDDKAMMLHEGVNFVDKKFTGIKRFIGLLQTKGALKKQLLSTLRNYENPVQKGLTDPSATRMLATADNLAARFELTRKEVDDYSHQSQQRYNKALKEGRFSDEIVPVRVEDLTGKSRLKRGAQSVTADGHPRLGDRSKLSKLGALEAKNRNDAIHTAANSSGIVDGAAAIAVTSGAFAKEKHLPILARLKSVAVTACDPNIMGFGPARAVPEALKAAGVSLKDVDFVEINEAFAGQVLACAKDIVKDTNVTIDELMDKLNVDGGSIPIGHPLSASGSRILLHAANRLRDDNKQYAVVSACIGGGQGIAMVIENPEFNPELLK